MRLEAYRAVGVQFTLSGFPFAVTAESDQTAGGILVDGDLAKDVPLPALASTADLTLVRHEVRIPLRGRPTRIEAILDPENKIPEITTVNNRSVWTAPAVRP